MMAGGYEQSSDCVSNISAYVLFDAFLVMDTRLRRLNSTEEPIKTKEGDKEVIYSHHYFGRDLEAYSRTTRDNGKWVTVQVRRWNGGMVNTVAIDIFDKQGKIVASSKKSDCRGRIAVSSQDKQTGKDVIIQSALRAVTGQDYPVVVANE